MGMRGSWLLMLACSMSVACSTTGNGGSGSDVDSTAPDDTGSGGADTTTGGDTTTNVDTGGATDTSTKPDVPPGACTEDMECAASQYCVFPGGTCSALGSGKCSGTSASTCGGAGPKCKDGSCFWSGACAADSTCHAGETCVSKAGASKLCFPTSPCKETVTSLDVANGKYAPGKEVCIRDVVHDVLSEPDGDYHIRMGTFTTAVFGTCPYPVVPPGKGLVTELTPEYQAAGLTTPAAGSTVTVQGTVRWDGYHCWWEIHPVKYIGP
jgi:hypothetical protein